MMVLELSRSFVKVTPQSFIYKLLSTCERM